MAGFASALNLEFLEDLFQPLCVLLGLRKVRLETSLERLRERRLFHFGHGLDQLSLRAVKVLKLFDEKLSEVGDGLGSEAAFDGINNVGHVVLLGFGSWNLLQH